MFVAILHLGENKQHLFPVGGFLTVDLPGVAPYGVNVARISKTCKQLWFVEFSLQSTNGGDACVRMDEMRAGVFGMSRKREKAEALEGQQRACGKNGNQNGIK
jgi:hypothetical protein